MFYQFIRGPCGFYLWLVSRENLKIMRLYTSAFSLTTLDRVLRPPGVKLFLSWPSLKISTITNRKYNYGEVLTAHFNWQDIVDYLVKSQNKKLVGEAAARSKLVFKPHLEVALCSLVWLPLKDSVTLRPPSIPLNRFYFSTGIESSFGRASGPVGHTGLVRGLQSQFVAKAGVLYRGFSRKY